MLAVSFCHAGTVDVQFTGLPAVYENGTYNGFAVATVDGMPNQSLLCDDSGHTTYVPSGTLQYNLSSLGGPNPLEYARFAEMPPAQSDSVKYDVAAVLLYQLASGSVGADADWVTDFQYAIWNLFTPSETLFRPNQSALQLSAENIVDGITAAPAWLPAAYRELMIYTPADSSAGNQEFLALDSRVTQDLQVPQSAPEPSSGSLIALLSAVGVLFRGRQLRIRCLRFRSRTAG
ncbi:MAG TPA: hypothetical protein VKU19_36635 [Bryobacteraceae bacterium]|nr:hypothetical protein [Bryobacteraceae bacterium]